MLILGWTYYNIKEKATDAQSTNDLSIFPNIHVGFLIPTIYILYVRLTINIQLLELLYVRD